MSPNPAATWHGSPYGTDVFTYEHATAVYMLAQCPSRLGRQVSSALSVLQQALDRYGSVCFTIRRLCMQSPA